MEAERFESVTATSSWSGSSNLSSIVLQHYTHQQLTGLRVAILLLAIVGLLGNLLVVLVILSRRRWRFANSMFVLNIAIANLFICAFTLPLMARALFDITWKPAIQFCQMSGFLDNTAFACSAWSLALGSIERFFLVVFPMRHRQFMKYQLAVMMSLVTWAVSIFLSVMPILGWNEYRYSPLTFTCGIDTNMDGFHLYYFLVYLTFVLPGPLIISTVSYSYILFYLRVHCAITAQIFPKKAAAGDDAEQENSDIFGTNMSELWKSPKRRSKNIKVVLPMILISIAFLICFLPTVIVGFDITINPGHENGQPRLQMIEYFIIHLLLLGNSAMNPLIFTMCSPKFRVSAVIVIQLVGERLVLVLFYIIYVVYYTFLTLFKAIGSSLSRAMNTVTNANCVSKYDSLNDVVIKITISNEEGTPGQVQGCQNAGHKCEDGMCCDENTDQMVAERERNAPKNNEYEIELAKFSTPDNPTSETVL